MSTGVVLQRSTQSSVRRRRTMAGKREPRLGMFIQGRMRDLAASTRKGRFFSRCSGVHAMNFLGRGEPPGGGAEAEHGSERPLVAVVQGVAHLGAAQGLKSQCPWWAALARGCIANMAGMDDVRTGGGTLEARVKAWRLRHEQHGRQESTCS